MTTEQWERRIACALGMAIYIHITRDNLFLTFIGTGMCMIYASMPSIQKWIDHRSARLRK